MIRFFEKDPYSPIQYSYDVEKIIYRGKSKFQEIIVIKNPYFGKMLILDNVVQLTERDEFFYHEMLAHILLSSHPCPKRVVVIGGGDGGTVREVLKHKSVEKVYLVEIDEEVINISKREFPFIASGLNDSRVEIKAMDGADFIKNCERNIDAVIVDSTDIVGFAKTLFTTDFFKEVNGHLVENGMFVSHSESLHFHKNMVTDATIKKLKDVFPIVDIYTMPIATYSGNWWAFCVGSKKLDVRTIRRKQSIDTIYYNDEVHKYSFLPNSIFNKLISDELKW